MMLEPTKVPSAKISILATQPSVKVHLKLRGCGTNTTTRQFINMKRKLNEDNVPTAKIHGSPTASATAFNDLGLDARLLQALVKENFSKPTPVQSKAIPLALEGTDILGIAGSLSPAMRL